MDQWSIFSGTEVRISQIQKNLYSWWKKTFANPTSKMNDFVKHVFREHNQEADRWANFGIEGQRQVVVDRCSNAETWKAVKGFWDGSAKDKAKYMSAFLNSPFPCRK